MLVNAEIKCLPWEPDSDNEDRAVVRAAADMLQARALDAIVSSFDLGAVERVPCLRAGVEHRLAHERPRHCRGRRQGGVVHGHGWLNPDRIAALRVSPAEMEQLHARGVRLNVWTVDDPEEMRALTGLGVDAIITNEPDVALDVLDA